MKKKHTAAPTDPDILEQQAQAKLSAGKYKEAIGLYKKLLQASDSSEWHKKLAYCYVQRASALAAKGMVKEAVVLWENHRQHTQAPYDAYDQYLIWLILSKNKVGIQENIQQLSAQQLDKEYPELAAVLGLLTLTEYPEFALDLPQDSTFIAHFQLVKVALQAYQDNNQTKLDKSLKQLPYRSAFRDLRTVLNALIALPNSVEQAQALLAKISEHSAYSGFARLLLVSTFDGAEVSKSLVELNHRQRNIIANIKGFNKSQLEFLEHLTRQHDRLSDKVKFNMAIQYQSLCGTELAKDYCQQILASYPAGHKDFKKSFGAADEFEENRIKALLCEQEGDTYNADYYWRLCINELIGQRAEENGLKIALILRHLSKREEPAEQTELLIESLQYDAEDRDIYLQILSYYQQAGLTKDYKLWLTKTLEKFPQDIDVLMQAAQEATRNKTYKKASQYATKILKIDPLNTFAKQTLFSSHLAHARRLMHEKSYRLVEKEIVSAEALNIGKSYARQTQLMRALLYFANEDKVQGLPLIVAALERLHADPVNMHFHASMELLSVGLPVATILRALPPAKDHLFSESEFTQFMQLLEQFMNEFDNNEQIHKALEKVKAPLKKSLTSQDFAEPTLLRLCKILEKLQHFELLRHCAKLAFAKWKKPIWLYYRVYSGNNGQPEDCTFREVMSLQYYHEQAMQNKDFQAGMLLEKLLDRYYQVHPQSSMSFLDSLFGIDEEEDDELNRMDALFSHIPDEVLIKLNKTIESLSKKTSIEQVAIDLMQSVGNNQNIMMAIMEDPELFSALMVVKSADKLGINIDVSIDDVLKCFGVGKNTGSFPF
jgi:tetratricopeptide (TPR) repeat protein